MTVQVERFIACKSAVKGLWAAITDTERMNRAVGMESVRYTPIAGRGAARYLAHTSLGGFPVTYEEPPAEWVEGKSFVLHRKVLSGPVYALQMSFLFEPAGAEGTRVTARLEVEPRVGFIGPILKLRLGQSLTNFEREIQRIDAALARGEAVPPLPRRGRAASADSLSRMAASLADKEPAALVARLVELLRDGDDSEIPRLRPFELAERWGEPRLAVLSMMLHAVGAGLLELRWEVICPSCRVPSGSVPSLANLSEHGECQLCELSFGLELDEALEATFAPSRAVREFDAGPYCIGGAARVPHVVAQALLPEGGEARLRAPAAAGRYRLFVRGGAALPLEVAEGGAPEIVVEASSLLGSPPKAAPLPVTAAPGAAVVVRNRGGDERHVKIERSSWTNLAATAREVTSLPGFRRDFSSDVLRPGASLRVSRVTLFFSDLTASTQLYSTVGDASAFRLVQDHFEVVIGLLESHQGSLVKTIGDAVMAVFSSEDDGLSASLSILQAFETFREQHPHRMQTHIKLGLHSGPCYVVTANQILDYFGQTVNIAARLQAQAESGELVVDRAIVDRGVEAGTLPEAWVRERYEARLKGVDAPLAAARVRVA